MKTKNDLIGFIFLIAGLMILPGCYTTIWSPDQNVPDQVDNSDSFYPENYYGDYNTYYNSPWWIAVEIPSTQVFMPAGGNSSYGNGSDSSRTQTFIRNMDGGRGSGIRNTILDLLSPGRIVSTGSGASRNTSYNNNSNTNNNTTSSNNSTYAPVRTERVQNSNNNSNNSTSTRESSSSRSSSNSNTTRNNDGGRKNSGGR